ncbi:MAG: hypothetical protein JWQ81_4013 [Amycolatopsis sp.]|nr:hypothetical protein [Amycolatopsis sp.]
MHGVFLRARGSRLSRVFVPLSGLLVLAAVSACGPDLSKANFPRTTMTAQASAGAPAAGADDPAFGLPAQRLVDTCALVGKDVLGSIGTVSGTADGFGLEKCSNDVKDAGGKAMHVAVELGSLVIGGTTNATGTVQGMPEIVDKSVPAGCTDTAVTSTTPHAVGISVDLGYDGGGDPCPPAHTVLDKILQLIKTDAPKLADASTPGSLVPVDPCTSADAAVAADVSGGQATTSPTGLHGCGWGDKVQLTFSNAIPPSEGDGYKAVDLGGGISAFQKTSTAGVGCDVKWQHRTLPGAQGETAKAEIVDVNYSDYSASAAKVDVCPKAVQFAKSVVTKLPKP